MIVLLCPIFIENKNSADATIVGFVWFAIRPPCTMDYVPVEVYDLILSFLSPAELARLACCCSFLHELVLPHLYKHLQIDLRSGDPDVPTTKALQVLSRNTMLRRSIRSIAMANAPYTFWTAGHSKLLSIVLSTILEFPERIRSFVWKSSLPFTKASFPNLQVLHCSNVQSNSELEWVRWHLTNCPSLETLHLGLTRRSSPFTGSWLLSGVRQPRLRALSLQGMNLSDVEPGELLGSQIQSLQLKYCQGMDQFLCRLQDREISAQLKILRLTGIASVHVLQQFLFQLGKNVCLEELSLCIGSTAHSICLRCIQAHAPALRLLVLDFRYLMQESTTSIPYSLETFQDILQHFPRLESLGLPLDMNDRSAAKYKRLKFKVSHYLLGSPRSFGLTSCSHSQLSVLRTGTLRTLHIRRHCSPWRRFVNDAKHAAAPFRRHGTFQVLMDHGARLRKLVYSPETSYFCQATDSERQALCTDL